MMCFYFIYLTLVCSFLFLILSLYYLYIYVCKSVFFGPDYPKVNILVHCYKCFVFHFNQSFLKCKRYLIWRNVDKINRIFFIFKKNIYLMYKDKNKIKKHDNKKFDTKLLALDKTFFSSSLKCCGILICTVMLVKSFCRVLSSFE